MNFLEGIYQRLQTKKQEILLGEKLFSVESVIRDEAESATFGNIKTSLNMPKNLPSVHTDNQLSDLALSLKEALSMLITNVKDHAGDNPELNIDVNRDSDFLYIQLTDDGPGIKGLSKKFTRMIIEHGTGDVASSLSIACYDVHWLGGIIIPENVKDEQGKTLGARFTIQLPIDRTKMNFQGSKELATAVCQKMSL